LPRVRSLTAYVGAARAAAKLQHDAKEDTDAAIDGSPVEIFQFHREILE
jgi:hypothetical protein